VEGEDCWKAEEFDVVGLISTGLGVRLKSADEEREEEGGWRWEEEGG
jgi:hypothetical protein